jgi:hypothetical protein
VGHYGQLDSHLHAQEPQVWLEVMALKCRSTMSDGDKYREEYRMRAGGR